MAGLPVDKIMLLRLKNSYAFQMGPICQAVTFRRPVSRYAYLTIRS